MLICLIAKWVKAFVPEFQATIPFSAGIRRTLEWFDADENRKRIDDNVNREMDKILKAYAESMEIDYSAGG